MRRANSEAEAPLCGFASLTFVAVTKTLLTKLVLKRVDAPVAFSVLSCVASIATLLPIFAVRREYFSHIQPRMYAGFTLVCLSIAVDLGCTNVAISELSVALQQCIKAASPAATIILESILWRRLQHPAVYLTIIVLCAGAAVTELGSSDYDASLYGVLMMSTAVLAGALKYVLARQMIREYQDELGPLAFCFWVEVIVGILLTPWAVLSGEMGLLFWPDAMQDVGSGVQTAADYSTLDWALLWFTAAYGGVRLFLQIFLLQFTSATTLALSNVTIQAFTIILGIRLFHTEVTPTLVIGVAITLLASAAYTYIKVCGSCDPRPLSPGKAMH